ncbi:globin [Photobacterium atrarenae]|uniref:Globin n=1 Tax=Photobacterium atrarenae TaxID=865757 RepID=A0ABY5GKB0_9GAMM|nr:globin [Photobacterium atrarenae]UTV29768.1 globin [Photobacterium atrarenae]
MDVHECFNNSYARCNENSQFFDIFYDKFCRQDRRFRQMFKGVDMLGQIRMLKASIAIILLAPSSEQARDSVRNFGKRHASIGVTADDFEIWLDCLLHTVSQCDPNYSPEVEAAWRQCFETGFNLMKEACRAPSGSLGH